MRLRTVDFKGRGQGPRPATPAMPAPRVAEVAASIGSVPNGAQVTTEASSARRRFAAPSSSEDRPWRALPHRVPGGFGLHPLPPSPASPPRLPRPSHPSPRPACMLRGPGRGLGPAPTVGGAVAAATALGSSAPHRLHRPRHLLAVAARTSPSAKPVRHAAALRDRREPYHLAFACMSSARHTQRPQLASTKHTTLAAAGLSVDRLLDILLSETLS